MHRSYLNSDGRRRFFGRSLFIFAAQGHAAARCAEALHMRDHLVVAEPRASSHEIVRLGHAHVRRLPLRLRRRVPSVLCLRSSARRRARERVYLITALHDAGRIRMSHVGRGGGPLSAEPHQT